MSPADAAKLLDLPADASPEQLEARFLELRRKLEDKIAKAPTPGLQAKYRESLAEITTAFETLTLAADSSALPVANKTAPVGSPLAATSAPAASSAPGSPLPAPISSRPKSGGKEFLVVAVVAVVLLAGGGWFVMKTRAENAEKARIAAEAERKAADEKIAQERQALEKKRAEEAERTRLDKLSAQLRTQLAEAKVMWEAVEREERTAERKLGELKSDLRNLRDATPGRLAEARATVAAHQRYYDWLSEALVRHPAKIARGQAEELLSARQIDEAAGAVATLKSALASLDLEVAAERKRLLDLDGEFVLKTDANVTWQLEDAFAQVHTGTGSAQLDGVAVGPAKLLLRKPGWPERTLSVTISSDRPAQPDATYVGNTIALTSDPVGAEVAFAGGAKLGVTPVRAGDLPPGRYKLTVAKEGFYSETVELTLPMPGERSISLKVRPKGFAQPARWRGPARVRAEYGTSSQSTGPYGSNNSTQIVEEWDFSEPDATGAWQKATRRWLSLSGGNREYMPVDGSAVVLARQPDGTWSGNFTRGGLKNPDHNRYWTKSPTMFWCVMFGLLPGFFPAEPVVVGGTWAVQSEFFFGTIGLTTATGSVRGRLLTLERDAAGEWADVEYSYDYTMGAVKSQAVMKLRANVSDGYVVRMEISEAATAGELQIRTSSSASLSAR